MYCPGCHVEYVPGFTRCADCDVELVEVLPAAKSARRDANDDLVTVFASYDHGLAAVAESLLQSADIRFSVRGTLLPYPGAFPVDLQVLSGDADEARRILAELSAPEPAAAACAGHARCARGSRVKSRGQVTIKDSMPRPRSVSIALLIVAVGLTIGFVIAAWQILAAWDVRRAPLWGGIVVLVVVFAIVAGLFAALAFRRRWAYIVYLVVFAIGIPGVVSGVGHATDRGALYLAYYLTSFAGQIAPVVLLLRRPAREWYGISRSPSQPGEWRPDPSGRHQHRYWDGEGWTEHVSDEGVAGVDPLGRPHGGVPLTSASS